MLKLNHTEQLNPESIDIISEQVCSVGKSINMSSRDITALRLTVEEALIKWNKHLDENAEIEIISGNKMFRPYILLRCRDTKSFNPFVGNTADELTDSILKIISCTPDFYYSRGCNCISIRLQKPGMNPFLRFVLIILFGLLIGISGKLLLSASVISSLNAEIIEPFYSKFLDMIRCVAGPLIFFSVAWGIYGVGDVTTLTRFGSRMMLRYLRNVFICSAITVCAFPLFNLTFSDTSFDRSIFSQIIKLLLDIIPASIVEPFADGNTLQIIFLSIFVGIALVYLGKRSSSVAKAVGETSYIVNFIMELINKLVPAFIVLVIVKIIWSSGYSQIGHIWKLFLCVVAAELLCCLVLTLICSIRYRVRPVMIFGKLYDVFFVALSTASSAASFSYLVKSCTDEFGIDESIVRFGVPLGIVMNKLASAINGVLVVLYFAGTNNIDCSISWIIMTVILCSIVAVAIPPVPGGGVIGYSILFSQMGLPESCLGIALTLEMFTEFVITAANVYSIPFALHGVASRFSMVDSEKLASDNKKNKSENV